MWRCLNGKARSIIALWLRQTSGLHHINHNAAINLRNDAINKIKSTVGTTGTYACGGQGNKTRFSSNVDCSMKQEGNIVRYSIEAHRLKAVGSSPNVFVTAFAKSILNRAET